LEKSALKIFLLCIGLDTEYSDLPDTPLRTGLGSENQNPEGIDFFRIFLYTL